MNFNRQSFVKQKKNIIYVYLPQKKKKRSVSETNLLYSKTGKDLEKKKKKPAKNEMLPV